MEKTVSKVISAFFLVIFLPILFCVFVFGNNMDYFEMVKQNFLCHNIFLLPICIVFIVIIFLLRKPLNKITIIGKKRNSIIFACCAIIFFALMYVVNIEVSKCIVFTPGWDIGNVTGSVEALLNGHTLSEDFYYRLFPFNIFNVYYLYKLNILASSIKGYPYFHGFIWIQFSCLLFSLSGLFTALSVRRLTKKAAPTIFSMLLYAAFIGMSPWKIIPYTDTISFTFGIFIIYLFILSREARTWVKYVLWTVICMSAFIGAQIKASVYVPLIAVTVIQLLSNVSLKGIRNKLINIGATIVILFLCFGLSLVYKGQVIKEVGYDTSQDLELDWSHLVRLGLNDYSTGGFSADSYLIYYEYLDRPNAERQAEERRQIAETFKERGDIGSLYFYLRKNVMNYNDGTFCWYLEGSFNMGDYPQYSDSRFKPLLREFYWYEGRYYRYFLTYSQLMWLFTLLLIPGTAFLSFRSQSNYSISAVLLTLIGITLFVMLFEGRARYFLNLTPVYVLAASLCLELPLKKRKD